MRMPRFGQIAALWVALLIGSVSMSTNTAAFAASGCDEGCLRGLMETYVRHALDHQIAGVPLATTINSRENTLPVAPGQGIWAHVIELPAWQTVEDPSTGQVFGWGAGELRGYPDGSPLAAISLRLRVEQRHITEIETIANVHQPGTLFDAAVLLDPDALYDSQLPVPLRTPRATMIALANHYLDAVSGPPFPPLGADMAEARCRLFENGRGGNLACGGLGESTTRRAIPGRALIERRFPVVDVAKGVAIGYSIILHPERKPPNALYMSEIYKVVHGKLRQIDGVNVLIPYAVPTQPTAGFR